MRSLRNENELLSRQLEVARREVAVVRGGLEEQVQAQSAAARSLRERVAELGGIQEKWEAEQERVKVLIASPNFHFFFRLLLPLL